jgi:uncharacterized protein
MKFELDIGTRGARRISSYRAGEIVVGDTPYRESILVSAGGVRAWMPQRFEDLAPRHFEAVVDLEPEVVLVGTGAVHRFPPAALIEPLSSRGIGVEIMDTGAACRAFNFLLGEDRRVVAALLVIEQGGS